MYVTGHTLFDSCHPIVGLALLGRNLLIWRKLHDDLGLIPFV